MFGNTGGEQKKQLYIPDFKLWNDYYQKRVNVQNVSEQTPQGACSSENSAVKFQFVSPVTETTNQAASIMKTDSHQNSKQTTNKKQKSKTKNTKKSGKKVQKRKPKDTKKNTFSYRKLNDIFSKKKK